MVAFTVLVEFENNEGKGYTKTFKYSIRDNYQNIYVNEKKFFKYIKLLKFYITLNL